MPTLAFTAAIVFLAELGDKTQLVCLGLVAKFGASRVLVGALLAALMNTALAVGLGEGLNHLMPLWLLEPLASLGFIGFGLWSLRAMRGEGNCPDVPPASHHPLAAICMAFFLAELGDKTQLVTLGLAAKQSAPLYTWLGAGLGLFAAQALAILASAKIAALVPPRVLKSGAAIVFISFGLLSLSRYLDLSPLQAAPALLLLFLLLLTARLWIKHRQAARARRYRAKQSRRYRP
jgi:putative Ca2+/H+ antiporter (TMEM165/GDT1 family)